MWCWRSRKVCHSVRKVTPVSRGYAALRTAMHGHIQVLLDFRVGTGARYGEAAGLMVRPCTSTPAVPTSTSGWR